MTIGDAKKMSIEQAACEGFTFEGPDGEPPDTATVTVQIGASAGPKPSA